MIWGYLVVWNKRRMKHKKFKKGIIYIMKSHEINAPFILNKYKLQKIKINFFMEWLGWR